MYSGLCCGAMGKREVVLAAPVLPTITLVIHPSSISPPSGGGVRSEKELKEGMQLAIELGTPGKAGLVGSRARQSASPVPLCFT